MPSKVKDTREHIVELVATLEPKMRKTFLLNISRMKNGVELKEIERLLERGEVETALATLTSTVDKFANDFIAYTVLSSKKTADLLDDVLDITISFDQTNFRAVEAMRRNKLRLVTQFSSEQRKATRLALIEGIKQGVNPRVQALAFRDSIGLTAKQQQAVINYRRLLEENNLEALSRRLRDRRFDSTVRSAVDRGELLEKDQIDRMVDRYQDRYIKYRSEVIARTEALRSAHEGTELMFNQAIDSGSLDANKLKRKWVTAHDERVRSSHKDMDGQERSMAEPFVSGEGFNIMYPGDPNAPGSETIQCRCIITTRFK